MKKSRLSLSSPKPGYTWNPLRQYPRNHFCFCGSGNLHKHCCRLLVLETCLLEDAEKLRIDWDLILAGKVRLELAIGPEVGPTELVTGSSRR